MDNTKPRDGWGNEVSDMKFVLSLLLYYVNHYDLELEPEDEITLNRIGSEHLK